MYNNGKTVSGVYPMSYCLKQLEGYEAVRKNNANLVGGVLVKAEASF